MRLNLLTFGMTTSLLSGCASVERVAEIHANERIQVAALQSQAVVGAEWARTQAAASVAQAQAMSEVARNTAWAVQVPWVILFVCLTIAVVAVIYWRGRLAEQTILTTMGLPAPQYRVLHQFAQEQGGTLIVTPDGAPFLQIEGGKRRPLQIRQTSRT